MEKAQYMYYIEKEDLAAYIATIGGTLVGYTPAKPTVYDPNIMWPAESEIVTKQGVVIIKHWADVVPDNWAPKNGLAIQSTNQRCYDWATAQPLVKRVEIPFVERWGMFTPEQLAIVDVPEKPAPAGVMIQQTLL